MKEVDILMDKAIAGEDKGAVCRDTTTELITFGLDLQIGNSLPSKESEVL